MRDVKRAVVVCTAGSVSEPSIEHVCHTVDDCRDARTVGFWTARLPPGVAFLLELWPDGWGFGTRHVICRHQAGEMLEQAVPPVAGSESRTVYVLLPHGAVRRAMIAPVRTRGNSTYALHRRAGDACDADAWEALVPTVPAISLPTGAAREVARRLRERAAAEVEPTVREVAR